jgi:hypothetical protein
LKTYSEPPYSPPGEVLRCCSRCGAPFMSEEENSLCYPCIDAPEAEENNSY